MTACRLDILPVELIHQLFGHFSAHEILNTFSHVSSYLDAILINYRSYQVNFQSISRTNFDLICQRITPDRVISLVLSDDQNTPGLVGLFLERFRINQFTDLQSLTLVDFGPDFWEVIMTQLVELKKLRSFVYSTSDQNCEWICNLSKEEVAQLDQRLFDSYAPALPQLHRLKLQHGDYLRSVNFPCLRHLTLKSVSADILKHVCIKAPQLKSLRTDLSGVPSTKELLYPLPQLIRLVLCIEDITVSMVDLERMLSNVPRLQRLELVADCDNDVVDGHRWQRLVKDLLTFKFAFYLADRAVSEDLDSFRTSFWLNKKHWFVAYLYQCLYSMPSAIFKRADECFHLPEFSTVPDQNLFYESIDSLSLSDEFGYMDHHFPRVQTLTLCHSFPLSSLKRLIDLKGLQHLLLFRLKEDFPTVSLLNEMPNLSRITIGWNIDSFLKQLHNERFENIRKLHIGRLANNTDVFVKEKLPVMFPNVEHIQIDSPCSIMDILGFLKQFKHLSTVAFRYILSIETDEDIQNYCRNTKSALDQARHQQQFNGTYRFDCSMVHLWI